MGDSDKLMDVESGQKEAYEEELPSDDDEGGKVIFIPFLVLRLILGYHCFIPLSHLISCPLSFFRLRML